jgi:hypothetical protein
MVARKRSSKSATRTITPLEQWSALPIALRKTAEEKLFKLADKHGLAHDQIVRGRSRFGDL